MKGSCQIFDFTQHSTSFYYAYSWLEILRQDSIDIHSFQKITAILKLLCFSMNIICLAFCKKVS